MSGGENFVKSTVLQATKRELQRNVSSSRFWIGLICVIAVLAISGPFDTSDVMSLPQRVIYWGGIATATYFLAIIFMTPVIVLSGAERWHWVATCLLAGVVSGIPIGFFVFLVNTQIMGIDDVEWADLTRLIIICTVVAIAVSFLGHLIRPQSEPRDAEQPEPSPPAFLKRLSPQLRGEILSLQAQDHYVEAVTTVGKELVLIRLGDAVEELNGIDGKRIHRSWWVSRSAIKGLKTEKDRLFVELDDARLIPVSRANEKTVKTWVSP